MRVNLNTASATTLAAVIGKQTTVQLWDSKRTGTVEKVINGRPIVRFPDGTWAYGHTVCTVR